MRKQFYRVFAACAFFSFTGNVVAQFADSALFNYSGGTTTFTVPSCVTSITIKAWGAGGGGGGSDGNPGGAGGGGAYSTSVLSVTSGQVLTISVGGGGGVGGSSASGNEPGPSGYGYGSGGAGGTAGSNGSSGSGGGGGGGTFLLNGSTILVAAGGGGGGGGAGNIGSPNASGPGGGGGGQNGFTLNYGAGGAAGASGNNNGQSGTARNGQDGGNAGGGGGGYLGGDVGAQPAYGVDGSGGGGGGGSSLGSTMVNGNAATAGYSSYPVLPAGCAVGGPADASYGTNQGGNGFLIIEYNLSITASASSTGTSCNGASDGTASVVAHGNAPFTYSWNSSPVQTDSTATGLSAGTYIVTVHDVNGCSATASTTVNQPTVIQFQSTNTQSFSFTGAVQNWVVPTGLVSATITATGAGGGSCHRGDGGPGANFSAIFTSLTSGDNISLVVGELGHNDYNNNGSGGGGGTFVYDSNTSNLLMVAAGGGGGGAGYNGKSGGLDLTGYSTNDDGADGGGGTSGSGGNGANYSTSSFDGAGAAGWLGNGSNGINSYGGNDMSNGFYGGAQDNSGNGNAGGYGGGGGGGYAGGGGGSGYNGGGGGNDYTYYAYSPNGGGGGGGGSYLNGGTVTGTPAGNNSAADGSATIEYIIDNSPVTTQNAGCGSNGIITAGAASGGTPPYSYNWTPSGGTGLIASGLSAGTYTLTATDSKGCTQTASAAVTGTNIIANATVTSNVTCYNGNNGSAISSPTGGGAPYTYLWSDATSATTASVSNLTAGSYTVTVSDTSGCSATASVSITMPTQFQYITAGTISNVSCNGSSTGHVTVTGIGGNLPYTYSWNGAAGPVSTMQSPNTMAAGSYTVTVTDNCGVSHTATATVTQPAVMQDSVSAQTNTSCGGGNGGSATIGASGGTYPYQYLWSNGASQATASALSAGSYSVVITDQHGCTNSVTGITITQPNPLTLNLSTISYPLCHAETTGAASVTEIGGTAPYTYTWSPAASTTNTAMNIAAGSYTVSVKDAHRCTASLVVVITQPAAIHDSVVKALTVNVACKNGSIGSATIGVKYGTAPYTYVWGATTYYTSTVTGLSAGTYSVTIEDANGCQSTVASLTITQPAMVQLDSVSLLVNTACYGGDGGVVSIGTRGGVSPYTYGWSDGKTGYNVTGLTAGTYSVIITDKAGCSNSISSITITQPSAPVSSTINTDCTGNDMATVTIGGSGGTPGYSYLWSNGKTTTSLNVANGTYTVKVSDSRGCSATNSVMVLCDAAVVLRGHVVSDSNIAGCCGDGTLTNINLYPNPTSGQFTIQLSGVSGQWSVEVYSVLGQKVYTQSTIHQAQTTINLSNQPNGIYLIRIIDSTGTLVGEKKVVKTN